MRSVGLPSTGADRTVLAVMVRLRQIALLILAAWPATVVPDVIHVPAQSPSIQDALDGIGDGDTILVAIGVYSEALIAPPLHFVLKGDVSPDTGEYMRPIIDPTLLHGSDSLGCLYLPESSRPVLEDLMFRNGPEMYPHWDLSVGGILSYGNSITMRRCIVDSTYRSFYHWRPNGENIVDSLLECVFRQVQVNGVVQLDHSIVAQNCDFVSGNAFFLCSAGPGSRITACHFGADSSGSSLVILGHDVEVSNCTFGTAAASSGYLITLAQTDELAEIRDNIFAGNVIRGAVLNVHVRAINAFLIRGNTFLDIIATQEAGTCIHVERDETPNPSWGGTIQNNQFSNCFGYVSGANAAEADGDIALLGNHFVETQPDPYRLPTVHITQGDGSILRRNVFSENGFALQSDALMIDAELNWWSDSSGPYHATQNPGGLGDTILGEVDFTPWYPDTSFLDDAHRIHAPLPEHFTLDVYPNPFNSAVRLRLIPNEVMIIRVELFDILGRHVADIWSGPLAYEKQITFDGGNLSSGVYFVRVWQPIGNRSLALTKLVLLK
jgi:hypothetical protein